MLAGTLMQPVPLLLPATRGSPFGQSIRRLAAIGPGVLFGARLWAAACLALYIAFWLQLDNAYWAATTAAIVTQPSLGASLRKARFRLVGTALGATATVILTALFPQSRLAFLLGLALWGAACGFAATLLRNAAAYGAALAGITAVLIAGDELGATGGPSGDIFLLAVTRLSEISIGIACATLVMATTDLGRARQRLAALFAELSAEILDGLCSTLSGGAAEEMRTKRRDLVRRVAALDPVIDEVIGEAPDLRLRSQGLRAGVKGLFSGLAGWQTVANHLEQLPADQGRQDAEFIQRSFPDQLRSIPLQGVAARSTVTAAVRALLRLPIETSSRRLLADAAADALIGIARVLDSGSLLSSRNRRAGKARAKHSPIPDYQPALLNAARILATMGAVELFWIVTAWSEGALAVTWATIFAITIGYPPNVDQAYANAKSRWLGAVAATAIAAIIKFAVLPHSGNFPGFALAVAIVLIPSGALSTLTWQAPIFGSIAAWVIPLINPENQITYDTQQFYNSALAILVGAGAATIAFRLIPPPSPASRAARLLALALSDLRQLAATPIPRTQTAWESGIFARLSMFPEQAEPLQRAQLLAALSVGSELIRLRRTASRLHLSAEVDAALERLAEGMSAPAREELARVSAALSAGSGTARGGTARLRALGSIHAISEALSRYSFYFDSRAPHGLR